MEFTSLLLSAAGLALAAVPVILQFSAWRRKRRPSRFEKPGASLYVMV
jgi:hypothetical protein